MHDPDTNPLKPEDFVNMVDFELFPYIDPLH